MNTSRLGLLRGKDAVAARVFLDDMAAMVKRTPVHEGPEQDVDAVETNADGYLIRQAIFKALGSAGVQLVVEVIYNVAGDAVSLTAQSHTNPQVVDNFPRSDGGVIEINSTGMRLLLARVDGEMHGALHPSVSVSNPQGSIDGWPSPTEEDIAAQDKAIVSLTAEGIAWAINDKLEPLIDEARIQHNII